MQAYYNVSMAGLQKEVRDTLFVKDRPILTKLRDEMPTRYAKGASVSNSLVSDGCVIEGKVENSIIFRGVTVRPGASVKGCIIMQDALIGSNVELENVILDKLTTVREGGRMIASSDYPIVVAKNLTI